MDFKDKIASLVGFVGFDYNGKPCGIDPINHSHYEMWYGDDFIVVKSIDEVMTTKIFDGKSIMDIFDRVYNIDF